METRVEEENRKVLAEQLDRRIKEDLERRDRQIREMQRRGGGGGETGTHRGIGPDGLVTLQPPLSCTLYGTTILVRALRIMGSMNDGTRAADTIEPTSISDYGMYWRMARVILETKTAPIKDASRSNDPFLVDSNRSSTSSLTPPEGPPVSLLKTLFTSPFYGTSQGRKKLQQLEQSVNQAAQTITPHPNILLVLGCRLTSSGISSADTHHHNMEQAMWTLVEYVVRGN